MGVDPLEKIAEIDLADPAVARVLRLQHAFGLRLQEASLFNPARDQVSETVLRVTALTGLIRVVWTVTLEVVAMGLLAMYGQLLTYPEA